MGSLYEKIEDLGYGEIYSFNKPGSKGNYYETDFYSEYYKRDVISTSPKKSIIEAVDEIRNAEGRAASLYGSDDTVFLVNGTSSGVIAAVSAVVGRGGSLVVMRESDLVIYGAAELLDIKLTVISGEYDTDLGFNKGITLEDIEDIISRVEKVDAVYLTSPSIEGISSEIDDISEFLHEKKIPLIVDASNGSHFGMAGFLPINAVECGADVVINALYTTLPSPVQTGLMHINGSLVDSEKIKRYLSIYQSHEPSYVLMAGIDDCVKYLNSENIDWQEFYNKRQAFSNKISELKHIGILDAFTKDRFGTPELCKVICYAKTKAIDAATIGNKLLKEYKIKALASMPSYTVFLFSPCDSDEGYSRLSEALIKMDEEAEERDGLNSRRDMGTLESLFGVKPSTGVFAKYPEKKEDYLPSDTLGKIMDIRREAVPLNLSDGRIVGDYITLVEKRVPVLIPGETITKDKIMEINHYISNKVAIEGILVDRIQVLVEKKD